MNVYFSAKAIRLTRSATNVVNGPLLSFALSPSKLNFFVLASGSESNAVDATVKEGGGEG